MRKALLSLVLFLSINSSYSQSFESSEFIRFIYKGSRLLPEKRSFCKFYYFSVLVNTDKTGTITKWAYVNDVPEEVRLNFDFLKGYKFPDQNKLHNGSLLFFITVDQTTYCPDARETLQQPTDVMSEVLKNISVQLKTNPDLRIMYTPIAMKYYPMIICRSLSAESYPVEPLISIDKLKPLPVPESKKQ